MSHPSEQAGAKARRIRDGMPPGGLFAGQHWRISPDPFPIGAEMLREFEFLGRVLLQFYRSVNLLYRQSLAGKAPAWVAHWLDLGKPAALVEQQRAPAFKHALPRVIRPDVLLNDSGFSIIELDSVPGGIGLTAWLNEQYAALARQDGGGGQAAAVVGGADGMLAGFAGIFDEAPHVHIVVSAEAATYRPEMEWLATRLGTRFQVRDTRCTAFEQGDAVYRFFELFDLANVDNAEALFSLAADGQILLTPPPKPIFEEKMLFALLWNRNLQSFWRQHLGESFYQRLLRLVPYTWLVDPAPLPPHGAIPELNLTDWRQLQNLSQKGRDLILKVSGFSDKAWGSRGVFLGSDLAQGEWSAAVEHALASFERSPCVLQRYHHPGLVKATWYDFERGQVVPMAGRARLCPYYFVVGQGDNARTRLGGVLATICPADKKLVHGMTDAILAPCATVSPETR